MRKICDINGNEFEYCGDEVITREWERKVLQKQECDDFLKDFILVSLAITEDDLMNQNHYMQDRKLR